MGYISEEKLNKEFKRFDVLELEYVTRAKDVALRLNQGLEVSQEEIKWIRNQAVNDRKHLKGDFVISMFLELIESGVKFERWQKGKSIHTNDKELLKVYRNHFSKKLNATEFCKRNAMTRNKYYRIVNCDVKNPEHREVMEKLKEKVQKEFEK